MYRNILETTQKLFEYCRSNNWAGYDPYDALNSELFKHLPFLDFWLPRLAMTQILKRSPLDLRRLLLIPKTQNPKAMGLFMMALLKLPDNIAGDRKDEVIQMQERIKALRSPNTSYWCWGYSFPWQGRAVIAPKGSPNLVCTVFVANALIKAYEYYKSSDSLNMATSAAEYLLNKLYWSANDIAGFSYPIPSHQSFVHNANFLGAALLCQIYKHTGEKKFLESALRVTRCSVARQHQDGSWDYGEDQTQRWIDNFHTGYNLLALRMICQTLQTDEFESNIRHGYEFFKTHFFREDGAPKYFHNKVYPIDIHSVAQSIITLLSFSDVDSDSTSLLQRLYNWTLNNMLDEKGFFYYQITPIYKNRISYMRWSQAWMLLALSSLCNVKL